MTLQQAWKEWASSACQDLTHEDQEASDQWLVGKVRVYLGDVEGG